MVFYLVVLGIGIPSHTLSIRSRTTRSHAIQVFGSLGLHDPVLPVHSMLCIYSTSSNITIAYNLGAIGGTMLAIQITSGILVGMTYVASDEQSFTTLDISITALPPQHPIQYPCPPSQVHHVSLSSTLPTIDRDGPTPMLLGPSSSCWSLLLLVLVAPVVTTPVGS